MTTSTSRSFVIGLQVDDTATFGLHRASCVFSYLAQKVIGHSLEKGQEPGAKVMCLLDDCAVSGHEDVTLMNRVSFGHHFFALPLTSLLSLSGLSYKITVN